MGTLLARRVACYVVAPIAMWCPATQVGMLPSAHDYYYVAVGWNFGGDEL